MVLAAAAFVALAPVTVKTEAMFHPKTLDLFLSTLSRVWLCIRLLKGKPSLTAAAAVGVTLGCAARARVLALDRRSDRHRPGRRAPPARAGGGARARGPHPGPVVSPSALDVRRLAGFKPADRHQADLRAPALLAFYVDLGLPDVVTHPYRPRYRNLALPTTYTASPGDYLGHWAWNGGRAQLGRPARTRAASRSCGSRRRCSPSRAGCCCCRPTRNETAEKPSPIPTPATIQNGTASHAMPHVGATSSIPAAPTPTATNPARKQPRPREVGVAGLPRRCR